MVISYVDSFVQCCTSKRLWLPLSYKDSGLEVLFTFQVWARLFCRSMYSFVFLFSYLLCSSRKYPQSPQRRDWNFLGCGGFCKAKKVKEMYEVYLEFPEGQGEGGVLEKIPSVGEVWIFSGITHCMNVYLLPHDIKHFQQAEPEHYFDYTNWRLKICIW